MNDTDGSRAQVPPWVVLIHQVPPKPDYLRVKVRRRLEKLHAAALKNSVYVLRNSAEAVEDFEWLAREIEAMGGSALIAECAFVNGISDEEIEAMLQTEMGDSFSLASGQSAVEPGRTWVTRTDVHVDRIASAWLIRRFIDAEAKFKFVPARRYTRRSDELRFDMYDAEYTHEGERCTFQTLVARFGLKDHGVTIIGEIVHDIDCKDDQFNRAETDGVASLIRGIARSTDNDSERLERGAAIFDDLYTAFRRSRSH